MLNKHSPLADLSESRVLISFCFNFLSFTLRSFCRPSVLPADVSKNSSLSLPYLGRNQWSRCALGSLSAGCIHPFLAAAGGASLRNASVGLQIAASKATRDIRLHAESLSLASPRKESEASQPGIPLLFLRGTPAATAAYLMSFLLRQQPATWLYKLVRHRGKASQCYCRAAPLNERMYPSIPQVSGVSADALSALAAGDADTPFEQGAQPGAVTLRLLCCSGGETPESGGDGSSNSGGEGGCDDAVLSSRGGGAAVAAALSLSAEVVIAPPRWYPDHPPMDAPADAPATSSMYDSDECQWRVRCSALKALLSRGKAAQLSAAAAAAAMPAGAAARVEEAALEEATASPADVRSLSPPSWLSDPA